MVTITIGDLPGIINDVPCAEALHGPRSFAAATRRYSQTGMRHPGSAEAEPAALLGAVPDQGPAGRATK